MGVEGVVIQRNQLFYGFNVAKRSCNFEFEFECLQKQLLGGQDLRGRVLVCCILHGQSHWVIEALVELSYRIDLPLQPI